MKACGAQNFLSGQLPISRPLVRDVTAKFSVKVNATDRAPLQRLRYGPGRPPAGRGDISAVFVAGVADWGCSRLTESVAPTRGLAVGGPLPTGFGQTVRCYRLGVHSQTELSPAAAEPCLVAGSHAPPGDMGRGPLSAGCISTSRGDTLNPEVAADHMLFASRCPFSEMAHSIVKAA